jgi:hypothetical protein
MTPFLRGLSILATFFALVCGVSFHVAEACWLFWISNSILWASIVLAPEVE